MQTVIQTTGILSPSDPLLSGRAIVIAAVLSGIGSGAANGVVQ